MGKLNNKGLEKIGNTTITDVNYRIDESGNEYIDVAYAESVKSYPYSEEKRI